MTSLSLSTPRLLLPSQSSRLPRRQVRPFSTPLLSPSLKPLSASLSASLSFPPSASAPQTPESAMSAAGSDIMGLLLRQRIIFLGSEIDDLVADSVISQLLLLDARDPKRDIKLFINSSGGSLSSTLGIFDVLQLIRADVETVALGIVASTATLLLGGGTKGKRFAMPSSRVMIHQPIGGMSGGASMVEIQANELMQNKHYVVKIISSFSGRTVEEVEKDMDKEFYMGPVEAVEYGIIDGIINKDSIIPLKPVPDKVEPRPELLDLKKYMSPEVPDKEIY